jgi:hypothetical protein
MTILESSQPVNHSIEETERRDKDLSMDKRRLHEEERWDMAAPCSRMWENICIYIQ